MEETAHSRDHGNSQPPIKIGRPFSVTILALIVLIVAGFYWIGTWPALSLWLNPSTVNFSIAPFVFVLQTVGWAILFTVTFWGLWRGKPWGARLYRGVTLFYFLVYWLQQIFLVQSDVRSANVFFLGFFSISYCLLSWWILSRPNSRVYFGEKHVKRIKNRSLT